MFFEVLPLHKLVIHKILVLGVLFHNNGENNVKTFVQSNGCFSSIDRRNHHPIEVHWILPCFSQSPLLSFAVLCWLSWWNNCRTGSLFCVLLVNQVRSIPPKTQPPQRGKFIPPNALLVVTHVSWTSLMVLFHGQRVKILLFFHPHSILRCQINWKSKKNESKAYHGSWEPWRKLASSVAFHLFLVIIAILIHETCQWSITYRTTLKWTNCTTIRYEKSKPVTQQPPIKKRFIVLLLSSFYYPL